MSSVPRRPVNDDGRPAAKRVRDGAHHTPASTKQRPPSSVEVKAFDGVPAIQVALGMNGGKPSAALITTLSTLRNQFSLRHPELEALITHSQTSSASKSTKTNGSYYSALPSVLQTSDPRLLLLEKWCQSSPGLEELFAVWDSAASSSSLGWSKSKGAGSTGQGQGQGPAAMSSTITSLSLNVLASILALLSSYYTFHPHAYPILKNLFSNERWRRLSGYIAGGGSTSNELLLVTLRLLSVVVERWDAKKVLEGFAWEAKSLPKLLQMRRKTTSLNTNPLVKPDIRTAYTLFLLSFLLPSSSSNSQIKTAFLQQHSFHLASLFKNLHKDHPALIQRVLEVSWEGIWCDVRVSRSLKVGVFAGGGASGILQNLLKLYERSTEDEDGIGGYTVADLVHHFLLAICTRPGVGLCFKDRGWYLRDVGGGDSEDEDEPSKHKMKLHNPTLLYLLKQLKPTDDPRQNELALKILNVCPELVSAYLPMSGLTLDPPRLSSKWIANVSFFASVVGGNAVPESTFFLDEGVYRPTPPPLGTIMNNVVPGGGVSRLSMRNVFTKGLQFASAKGAAAAASASPGNLVQHTTALALIRCLEKLGRVREVMEVVARALGEGDVAGVVLWAGDDEDENENENEKMKEGLWTRRLREVVKEARRRLPEFQVVLAFCTAHLKTSVSSTVVLEAIVSEGEQIKKTLLAESAMRLLWMYQEALPEVVEEARFDVGKVLVGFEVGLGGEADFIEERNDEKDGDHEAEPQSQSQFQPLSTPSRLHQLTQLHILRFLRASPAFSFTSPSPRYPGHTHLYSLLIGVVKLGGISIDDRPESGICEELKKLVKHVLGNSIVFQWSRDGSYSRNEEEEEEEEGEVDAWLASLPVGLRRVREVKRLFDVTADGNDEEGGGKTVTVYPETLDGTQLTDERLSVVNFLEDCILRCVRTPYKYIEELEKLAVAPGEIQVPGAASGNLPSPLIVTLVEQLEAKLLSQGSLTACSSSSTTVLLTPSDVLAIAVYIRMLVLALVGKIQVGSLSDSNRLCVLQRTLDRLDHLLSGDVWKQAFGGEQHTMVKNAAKREVRIGRRCLGFDDGDDEKMEDEDRDVDDFLDLIEALEIPSPIECRLTVYELIDWVRLLSVPLNRSQVIRLWGAVEEIWAEGLGEVIKYLDVPSVNGGEDSVSVWEALLRPELLSRSGRDGDAMELDEAVSDDGEEEDEEKNVNESGDEGEEGRKFDPRSLPFEYLLVHALPRHLIESSCQQVLAESALSYCGFISLHPSPTLSISVSASTTSSTTTAQKVQYVIRHILHRFFAFFSINRADAAHGLLAVLASLLEKIKDLDKAAFRAAKQTVVVGLKEMMVSTLNSPVTGVLQGEVIRVVREGLLRVQRAALDPSEEGDRSLVAEIAGAWADVLKGWLAVGKENGDMEYAGWWIRFVQPEDVLELLGTVVRGPQSLQDQTRIVKSIMVWCLEALKAALFFGEQYGRLSGKPQNLRLLFDIHATLSMLSRTQGSGRSERAEGVETVEELIAAMLEGDGVPVGLGGEYATFASGEGVMQIVEAAEARWGRLSAHAAASVGQTDAFLTAQSFLSQPLKEWTDATENIVRNLLYRQKQTEGNDEILKEVVIEWFVNGNGLEKGEGGERVVGVIQALLDCVLHRGEESTLENDDDVCLKIFKLLLRHVMGAGQRRTQAKDSLQTLVKILSASQGEANAVQSGLSLLEQRLKSLKKSIVASSASWVSFTPDLVNFTRWLTNYIAVDSSKNLERVQLIASDVAEIGIQWLIRQLGDEEGQKELDEETTAVCRELAALMKQDGVLCKAGSLETLLGVVVQSHYHIAQPECLKVVEVGSASANLKPLVVNKYLQGIIQHPHFFKLCAISSSPPSQPNPLEKIRHSITSFLKALFFLHPANTCQVSHIEPLVRIYGATLSTPDRNILSILRLFERQRKLSVRSVVGRWAPPSSSMANAAGSGGGVGLEALQNLDVMLVLRTALSFPVWRSVDGDYAEVTPGKKQSASTVSSYEAQLYDPLFLLFLLQHVLANGPPTSSIAWIELFRSNVVGLALRAISARDGKMREVGMGCVVAVWTHMQNADLQEREHVLYLLGLLKNALPPPDSSPSMRMGVDGGEESVDKYPPRLPSYTTLLLFHALRGIFNPSTFVYPLTSRFLLQRPELDITDVPMLYSMLYSSDTDDWKKERGWIMRFLADGILTGSALGDWRVLKRRHVWDLVASMYQGASAASSAVTGAGTNDSGTGVGGDRALKLGILDFLVNVTRHRGPTMSLVLKSGLLAWIEMQLTGPDRHAGFGIEWLRILENIIVVVDIKKLEASALKGMWVRVVGRCVQGILREAMGSPQTLTSIFPLAVRLIVRLCLIDSAGGRSLGSVLGQALDALKIFEANIKHRSASSLTRPVPLMDELIPPAQHSTQGLHNKPVLDEESLFFVWGRSVESLWRATMKFDLEGDVRKPGLLCDVWSNLISRLLVWRGLVGLEASPVGEWARIECVRNMGGGL